MGHQLNDLYQNNLNWISSLQHAFFQYNGWACFDSRIFFEFNRSLENKNYGKTYYIKRPYLQSAVSGEVAWLVMYFDWLRRPDFKVLEIISIWEEPLWKYGQTLNEKLYAEMKRALWQTNSAKVEWFQL